ncbi:MAG: hypothetical protein ACLPYZ_08600 [Limisphaerales bacterium]
MKFKNLGLVLVAGLAFAGTAGAQSTPSGLGFVPLTIASYSSSTLSIAANNLVNAQPFGVFAGTVPHLSDAQGDSVVISGISSLPETVDIPDFFQFGPSPANNQYEFTLTSIAETSTGVFQGAGTLVDSTDAYTFTDSTFTLAFAGESNYNVTFDTEATPVPEPTTAGCFLLGLGALVCFQRVTKNRRS